MNLIGNLIWLVFGGIVIAIMYFIGSLVLMITIVGIPFGIQTLKMGALAIWPFGRDTRVHSRASGCLYILMNVIWLLSGGLWIAVSHAVFGLILCITIIGIPFGLQHFKLTAVALNPFGRDIVNI
ncbi:MAG TPA: YccF domain-containing protein [Bacteroidales bacterium]|nr:YccF domain-containing protein [Bacteroidales bacterium]